MGKTMGVPLSAFSERRFKELMLWLGTFHITPSEEQMNRMWFFVDELMCWNCKMNLTGPKSKDRIVNELLLDSMLPAAVFPEAGRFLDIGSGAGFPAIPLKILKPSLTAHLLEHKKKRVSFLKHVIRTLGLKDIKVIGGRIQEQAENLERDGYDVITSRALTHLPGLMNWCAPHLRHGGLMVTFHGCTHGRLRSEDNETLSKHRMSAFKSIPYTLPGRNVQRELRILKRCEKAPQSKPPSPGKSPPGL
jgi:16S rRNA (guanine527-N7)-methyltransferase